MAKYRITGPDGATYDITAPDGASEQEIMDYVQRNAGMMKQPDQKPAEVGPQEPPAVAPRMGREDMSAYESYKDSPDAVLQRNPILSTLRDATTGAAGIGIPFADEMLGGLRTPIEAVSGAITGEDSGKSILDRIKDSYERGLSKERKVVKDAEANSPVATTVGSIAGGMATAGQARRGGLTLLNAAKPTIGSMALRGGGEGAAYGGAYGFGAGEGTEDRLVKGGVGAGIGAATGGGLGAISGKMAQNVANKTIPNSPQLKAAANAAYKEADQAGLVISPQSFSDKVDDIAVMLRNEGLDKTIHPKATAALVRLTEAQGGSPALSEIDTLRRVVRSAGASQDASERRLASMMTEKLDDWVNNLKPADVVSGDALKATSALNKGRDLWQRMRKTEMIDDAVKRATNRAASTGSGGNLDNAIRQNIRAILDNPKKARGFTQQEREMMEKVVKGGSMQNLARWVGKLSPEGNGLMMTLHAIGGYSSGGASLPLAAVGYGAKKAADAATPRNVDSLLRVVRSGGALPQGQLTAAQRGLLQSMLVGASQQGGLLDIP